MATDRRDAANRRGEPGWVQSDTAASDTAVDLSLAWTIARPGSATGAYTIEARLRGSGPPQMRSELDDLIKNVRYDPPVVPLPTCPGATDAAVATALASLAKQSPTWLCIPSPVGIQKLVIRRSHMAPPWPSPGSRSARAISKPRRSNSGG